MSQAAALAGDRAHASHRNGPFPIAGLIGWVIPFALVLCLAFQSGGYDPVLRSQVGIAVWWIVFLGAAVGVLPVVRLNRISRVGLGLLAAFVVWAAISLAWTESNERTMADVGKVAAYLGVLALALGAQGKVAMRHAVNGLAAGIAVVALLAVAYRLQPEWFSLTDTDRFFETDRNRLSYPLGYWNALAALMAIGIPLVLHAAGTSRTLAAGALAAGALPLMLLCAFLTVSRGGVVMISAAVVVYLLLAPERLHRVVTILIGGLGAALLVAAAEERDAVRDALTTAASREQSDQMVRLLVLVCIGVAALHIAATLVERHWTAPRWLSPGRRAAARAGGIATLALVAVFVAAGGPGWASDRWQEFRSTAAVPTNSTSTAFSRLSNLSSNGRYQYWQLSADARDAAPLQGTGSGTFEYLWSRNGTPGSGFVRDAHSLWMETQGELGWIGFFLIAGFFALALGTGAYRALREGEPQRRHLYAAATGGVAAFVLAASVEWVWEMALLPVIALVLAALLFSGLRPRWVRVAESETESRGIARIVMVALALPATVAIAIPLAGTTALRDSQGAIKKGAFAAALADARTAEAIQPFAASPYIQQALIYERAGETARAAEYARTATRREATNWRTWFILARIEAEQGHAAAAVEAFRRARSLNSRSPLFLRR